MYAPGITRRDKCVWYYRLRLTIWLSIASKLLSLPVAAAAFSFDGHDGSYLATITCLAVFATWMGGCVGMHGCKGVLEAWWKCPRCSKTFGFVWTPDFLPASLPALPVQDSESPMITSVWIQVAAGRDTQKGER